MEKEGYCGWTMRGITSGSQKKLAMKGKWADHLTHAHIMDMHNIMQAILLCPFGIVYSMYVHTSQLWFATNFKNTHLTIEIFWESLQNNFIRKIFSTKHNKFVNSRPYPQSIKCFKFV